MEVCRKAVAAKVHKIKKAVRPVLSLLRRKKRHDPEGAESPANPKPSMSSERSREEEDNAANEALESRLKDYLWAAPYSVCPSGVHQEGCLRLVREEDHEDGRHVAKHIPVHLGTFWTACPDHQDFYLDQSVAVTSCQTPEVQTSVLGAVVLPHRYDLFEY